MQPPKSKTAFRRWLKPQFDEIETLCELGEPDFFNQLNMATLVGQACRYACRFGGGDLIGTEQPTMTARQALVVIGRLLAWSEESTPDLLSVQEVAAKLGTSSRSVWRMLSAGEIPAPIKIRGKTKWRAVDLQAMIELSPSNKR